MLTYLGSMNLEHPVRSPKVLVVDKDENLVSAFRDFFRREKFAMLAANTGAAAKRIVEHEVVDLLIIDLTGFADTLEAFLRDAQITVRNIPLIVLCGVPREALGAKSGQFPNVLILSKPLELGNLRRAVHSLVAPQGVRPRR
jgi:DNA-binding response OmpR family regulator